MGIGLGLVLVSGLGLGLSVVGVAAAVARRDEQSVELVVLDVAPVGVITR